MRHWLLVLALFFPVACGGSDDGGSATGKPHDGGSGQGGGGTGGSSTGGAGATGGSGALGGVGGTVIGGTGGVSGVGGSTGGSAGLAGAAGSGGSAGSDAAAGGGSAGAAGATNDASVGGASGAGGAQDAATESSADAAEGGGCTSSPNSCDDGNPCNGTEICTAQGCQLGIAPAECSACIGGLCKGGVCAASVCGDGCVDATAGEECEPPGTSSCSASCKKLPKCGNGVREAGEDCDDGGNVNLDGCSGLCRFEQSQRANWLKLQFATDTFCTQNAFGGAMTGGTAQNQLQSSIDADVSSGATTFILEFFGLNDLSGTSDPALTLGVLGGSPVTTGTPPPPSYDGTKDLDWWHLVPTSWIDASRLPLTTLTASINAKVLSTGPGSFVLPLANPGPLALSSAQMVVSIGAVDTPLSSAGSPPGHLASEQLDPALSSFATMGQQNANGAGTLCGNISAASLAAIPIPSALVGGGLLACSQNYASSNSMLDMLVGGCTILFVQQVKPTQPDQVDASKPVAGAGGPYTLQANAQHAVATCRDKNNAVVSLSACLNAAAYSSFFKFATNRVIAE